jgi:beta-glucosidase
LFSLIGILNGKEKTSIILNNESIDQIISSLTLDEKAQLVIGTGMFFDLPDSLKKMLPPMFN